MRIELALAILVFFIALFGVYLAVFCGVEFAPVVVVYGICSYMMYKLNRWGRYTVIIVSMLFLVINGLTVNMLYGTGRNSPQSIQLLLDSSFNQTRYFIEIGFFSLLLFLVVGLLFTPGIARKFRKNSV